MKRRQISVTLDPDLVRQVDELCDASGLTRSFVFEQGAIIFLNRSTSARKRRIRRTPHSD